MRFYDLMKAMLLLPFGVLISKFCIQMFNYSESYVFEEQRTFEPAKGRAGEEF